MKKQLIIIMIIIVLFTVALSGCQGTKISPKKLNEKPNNFVNMTEEQMQNFPHLKEAILMNKSIDTSGYSNEMAELRGILEYFDTNFICYRNEYYEIFFICYD
jgi:hypothetical protein